MTITILFGNNNIHWKVDVKNDELEQKRLIRISIKSINSNEFNFSKYRGTLNLRSTNGKVECFINWGGYVTTKKQPSVRYRIGNNPPKTELVSISTNHESTFFPNPVDLIDDLRNADTSFFRITPYGDNPITYKFLTLGLDSILSSYPNFIGEINFNKDVVPENEFKQDTKSDSFIINYFKPNGVINQRRINCAIWGIMILLFL
tara:strand:+ start:39 stop:650 length:612 start_codon:yes stop_codon:yes gene_type:complete